jgi:hypothetical protein
MLLNYEWVNPRILECIVWNGTFPYISPPLRIKFACWIPADETSAFQRGLLLSIVNKNGRLYELSLSDPLSCHI